MELDESKYKKCLERNWHNRYANVKYDAKTVPVNVELDNDEQSKHKASYEIEEINLDSNSNKVMSNIKSDEQVSNYKKYIENWKKFADSYCTYKANGYICLNSLYKVQNGHVEKDIYNLIIYQLTFKSKLSVFTTYE